ncbi:MAG: aromatic-ring-hydroxylating dioxygenase subunit alpha [Rhodospirillaceae bacterium]|nr:aromatic-ring-hydroxylating dioxygenase subunit alpha [Rhodospirillaceae bacterium]|tara:strand:+ start:341 stop:1642 length:1302 start_codon:yes stop_codon:yes gene_type:complete
MFDGTADEISKLIEPGRVHRRVYTDSDIFELEMDRIFGCAWIFAGHTSQIPNIGDYVTSDIGRQPIIFIRHKDGTPQVLLNRCAHRGPKVCNEPCGNLKALTCLYHGWSYDTDGTLLDVSMPEGAASHFKKSEFGLAKAPRMGEYRGFVFVSMARKGISFDEFLGPMKANIDDLVDRAPDGEISLDAGMHRYFFRGNWKLQVENVLDSYHVPYSHASTVNKKGEQFSRREGDKEGAQVVEEKTTKTADAWKGRRSFVVDFGHGWTSNTELNEKGRSSPAYDAYKVALAEKVGKSRMEEILTPEFHNSLLYPNCSIMGLNIHIRVIRPIAPDLTEVTVYPVKLKGAPNEMNSANIRLLNVTHSATSFVQTDDLESFRRTQAGLKSNQSDWIDFSRGMGEEEADPYYNATRESAMHEMAIRAQYQAWLHYMCEAA